MRASYKSLAFRELDRLFRCGTAPLGDGALIGRFVSERNESAFEELVARHGPMVLGVCRRLLRSVHDADDAFQATFLVLAQNAARVRDPDRLGPWLYGVATRVATKVRARAGRHRHEPLSEAYARDEPTAEWSDVLPILDAELGRLPVKHRDVLVLCLLQGATAEEASRQLGCPVGTVKSRLARGRDALRARLTGRGISPTMAGMLASEAVNSPVPATLTRATLETIAGSKVAPGIVALMKGAVPIMLSKSTVAAALIIGGISLAGAGTAAWMQTSAAQQPGRGGQAPAGPTETTINNMKQILLAIHNFAATNDRLPASASYGADGQPKLSWRVAVLPYLDQNELYSRFHQDEPWDSPHNKALIDRMPATFETPGVLAPRGETYIRGFAGKGAIFEGVQGVAFSDITDGTSNTLMIAVAHESTPWTRPGELPFLPGQPLPALDDSDPAGYRIGMADGSVRSLAKDEARLLPSLITRAGGEVIAWPAPRTASATFRDQSPPPGAMNQIAPTPAPPGGTFTRLVTAPQPSTSGMYSVYGRISGGPPDALEQRLAVLEAKLDLIIRKLDATLGHAGAPRPGMDMAFPVTDTPKK
jgi:RNA polymerase sigma factor (sigma-70 family)